MSNCRRGPQGFWRQWGRRRPRPIVPWNRASTQTVAATPEGPQRGQHPYYNTAIPGRASLTDGDLQQWTLKCIGSISQMRYRALRPKIDQKLIRNRTADRELMVAPEAGGTAIPGRPVSKTETKITSQTNNQLFLLSKIRMSYYIKTLFDWLQSTNWKMEIYHSYQNLREQERCVNSTRYAQ